jgi:hypothetical protein
MNDAIELAKTDIRATSTNETEKKMKLIEKSNEYGVYGLVYAQAIIQHPQHGRTLIKQGFGGGDIEGSCYRWKHGCGWKIKESDTLESMSNADFNDVMSLADALASNTDATRPMIFDNGKEIEKIAKNLSM